MSKQNIRNDVLKKRKTLSKQEVERRSSIIHEKLLASEEYKSAKSILCYIDLDRSNEVETKSLIKRFFKDGKIVLVPFVVNEKVDVARITSLNDLEPGAFGILEPKEKIRAYFDKSKIDLILVPGIAFDKRGNRIGYGYGYYDEFLACTKCPKIGLAFDFTVIDVIPRDVWDVKVDKIITDSG